MKTLLFVLATALSATQGFAMDSLPDLHWKKRAVLVFGEAGDPQVDRQLGLLSRRQDALAERDMVLIRISGDDAAVVYGEAQVPDGRALRRETGAGAGLAVMLVGKDGGVKLRRETVVDDLEIFGLIDRMPMRQAEKSGSD